LRIRKGASSSPWRHQDLRHGRGRLLSITLVPVLMQLFVRGRICPEARNPINRTLICLTGDHPGVPARAAATIVLALLVLVLAATVIPLKRLGSEFMPTLNEGTLMYMPVSVPGCRSPKRPELMQTSDRIIKSFPEVANVSARPAALRRRPIRRRSRCSRPSSPQPRTNASGA